ncbi:MAG: helix-turn-helix domain-containing protein [Candidatus Entotheonellia bacterium]
MRCSAAPQTLGVVKYRDAPGQGTWHPPLGMMWLDPGRELKRTPNRWHALLSALEGFMISCQLSTVLGARRLSQARLARVTGIHRDIIRRLYYDEWTMIRRGVLDRLCQALQVPVDELLVWHEEEHGPENLQEPAGRTT